MLATIILSSGDVHEELPPLEQDNAFKETSVKLADGACTRAPLAKSIRRLA